MLKEIILVREEKQFNKLHKTFVRENDVDGSMGECCCNWQNEKAAEYILLFDKIAFLNIPRFLFAHWTRLNPTRYQLYSKVRFTTFFIEALMLFFGLIGYVFYQTFRNKEWGRKEYVFSLVALGVIIFIILIDFHWCRVVQYRAKILDKKLRRDEKQRKKEEAEEAKRREEAGEIDGEGNGAADGEQPED